MVNKSKEFQPITPRKFEAWCEWRKWCSVFRVLQPNPTEEEIMGGKEDDKTSEERKFYYSYLSDTIHKTLIRRLNYKFTKELLPKDFYPSQTDSIMCFDNHMKGTKAKAVEGFNGKTYKDYLFYMIALKKYSVDDIFHGWVLGKNPSSCINTVAASFAAQVMQFERGKRGGITIESGVDPISGKKYKRRIYRPLTSLHAQVNPGQEENATLYALLADTTPTADFLVAVDEYCKSLSREEKLILVAAPVKVLNHPQFLKLIGWGDEKVTKTKNALFKRLKSDLGSFSGDNWECREFLRRLRIATISELKSEKDIESFLLNVVEPKEGKE